MGWRRASLFCSLIAVSLLAGCASRAGRAGPAPEPYTRPTPDDAAHREAQRVRQAVVETASRWLAEDRRKLTSSGRDFRWDCSGFVEAVYAEAGRPVRGSVQTMFHRAGPELVHRRAIPVPGDVVFFRDTYDRNGNRLVPDELTHIGIVVAVDPRDGSTDIVHVAGWTARQITTTRLNLQQPDRHRDEESQVINSYLRVRKPTDARGTPYLAGQLWVAFGSLWMPAPGESP